LIPADSLRAVLDSVFRSRAYVWSDEPRGALLLREWWLRLRDWLDALRSGHPTLFLALIVALILVLAVILVHGLVVMILTVRGAAAREGAAPTALAARRGAGWYFREADALAERGRYADAMQAAFVGLALELDERGVLRFHPSKTPGEYVREARLAPGDQAALGSLVSVLYSVVFGGAAFGAADYNRWRAAGAAEWHANST
jgi:Domain of unknown function (DUF4129)